jgi:hypothetical protein
MAQAMADQAAAIENQIEVEGLSHVTVTRVLQTACDPSGSLSASPAILQMVRTSACFR